MMQTMATPQTGVRRDITIASPKRFQVLQRDAVEPGQGVADITVSGSYRGTPAAIEARWNGGSWVTIVASPSGETYSGTLPDQPAGQGLLEVRFTDAPQKKASIPFVGVGDVFLCIGQSNMSGRGTNPQTYTHATLKASCFGNDYRCRELVDPYDSATGQKDTVSSDTSPAAGGSVIPPFVTYVMADQGVPVMVIPAALGGTRIAAQSPQGWAIPTDHEDRTTLYGSAIHRAKLCGGVVAALWWQGESDVVDQMAQATYAGHLGTLADAIQADLGCKLLPVLLQNGNGMPTVDLNRIRAALVDAWSAGGNVLHGADYTGFNSDDGFHLRSDANLTSAASFYWLALRSALYDPPAAPDFSAWARVYFADRGTYAANGGEPEYGGLGLGVGEWRSVVGSEVISQATAASKPLRRCTAVSSLGGKAILWTDGSADYATGTIPTASARTWILVIQKRSAATASNRTLASLGSNNAMLLSQSALGNAFGLFSNQTGGTVNLGGDVTVFQAIVLRFNSASSAEAWVGATHTTWDPNDNFATGTTLSIGGSTSGGNLCDIQVAAILGADTAVSISEINKQLAYLSKRYPDLTVPAVS